MSAIHPFLCACARCRQPMPGERACIRQRLFIAFVFAIAAAILAIGATLIMGA